MSENNQLLEMCVSKFFVDFTEMGSGKMNIIDVELQAVILVLLMHTNYVSTVISV